MINGAPGVGKSTLARRYADEHPLSLVIDIDAIRMQLGGWAELEESRSVARDLAVALANAHLQSGHTVIVPQYIGRPELVERLRQVADGNGTRFVEVILTDDTADIVRRFRERRAEHDRSGATHPESELSEDAIASEIATADAQLRRDAALVISAAGGPAASLESLHRALAEHG